MSSHLARCHFTIEPIAVAVHRTMAEEHPIALLLNTHLRFHISNDAVAAYTLSAHPPHVLPRHVSTMYFTAYFNLQLFGNICTYGRVCVQ